MRPSGGRGPLDELRRLEAIWGELRKLVFKCWRAKRVTEEDEDQYSELLGQAQILHGRVASVLGVPVMEKLGRQFDAFQFVLAQPSLSDILGGALPPLDYWDDLWALGASAIRQAIGRLEAEREGGGKTAPEAGDGRKIGATPASESPSSDRSVFLAHSFDSAGKLVANVLRDLLALLGFRVVTGEAYSPRGVSSKIKDRIREQAVAVCILTRRRGTDADAHRTSQWVLAEAAVAEGLEKPVFLLIEKGVQAEIGIHGDREYIPFTMRSLQAAMIKLLQGLRELGYEFAPEG
jgi:hypothetical protein